jgi:hypothetical protein
VTESINEVVMYPAYQSHKLLLKMEEKEFKFKQLQRVKELAMRHKTLDKGESGNDISFDKRRESSLPQNNIENTMNVLQGRASHITSARRSSGAMHTNNLDADEAGGYDLENHYLHQNTHNQIKVIKVDKISKDTILAENKFMTANSVREKSVKKKNKVKQCKIVSSLADGKVNKNSKNIEISQIEIKNMKEYGNKVQNQTWNTSENAMPTGKRSEGVSSDFVSPKHLPSIEYSKFKDNLPKDDYVLTDNLNVRAKRKLRKNALKNDENKKTWSNRKKNSQSVNNPYYSQTRFETKMNSKRYIANNHASLASSLTNQAPKEYNFNTNKVSKSTKLSLEPTKSKVFLV